MPSITLSKYELLKDVGKKVSDEELANRISMLGTDLESIEDDDINVEIFPNRPDLLSQQGFGRALASFIGVKPGLRKYTAKKSGLKVTVKESVKDCRPFTSCAVIRGLTIDDEKLEEIIQIQEKLHVTFGRNRKRVAIGIYPMEHITPPITFTGLAPNKVKFTPLESSREMTAKEILEEHDKGKEYAHLVLPLKHYACFIDGAGEYMSFTPIINSNHVGKVTDSTTAVFLECSGFDFRIVNECTTMITCALADMGGQIETVEVTYEHGDLGTINTPDLSPREWTLDEDYINRVLGLQLKPRDFKELLEKMGYAYDEKTKQVLVPTYRTDILHQADFAEDIAIAYGYENFTPSIPHTSTVGELSIQTRVKEQLKQVLIGHGLTEMKNYHLVNHELQELIDKNLITLKSSVSKEFDTLRHDIIVSLLGAASRNTSQEYPQRTFEIGTVFKPEEEQELGILLLGEDENYTAARQILDSLLRSRGLEGNYEELDADYLLPGRAAKATAGNFTAVLGEVHPKILAQLGIEMPGSMIIVRGFC